VEKFRKIASMMPPRVTKYAVGSFTEVLYWMFIIAIFSVAAAKRFSLPQQPLSDPDTFGYINAALSKLTEGKFVQTGATSFIYPGFVVLVLSLFDDFRALAVAQHILGLAAGAILLLCWNHARYFLKSGPRFPVLHRLAGLLLISVFLFTDSTIVFEHEIRPEGIVAFVAILNIFLGIQFLRFRFIDYRSSPAFAFGILAVFNSFLLNVLKPSFGLTMVFAWLPVIVSLFETRERLTRRLLLLGSSFALVFALLWLPENHLKQSDQSSSSFVPTTLFVIHADIIRDQMADDLQANDTPYPQEWLGTMHDLLASEIEKSSVLLPHHYPLLGFEPDYLMHRESFDHEVRVMLNNDFARQMAFYQYYFVRAWKKKPLRMLEKVGRQLAIFYAPKCPAYQTRKIDLGKLYTKRMVTLNLIKNRNTVRSYPPAVKYIAYCAALQTAGATIRSGWCTNINYFLAFSYLPVVIASVIVSVITFCLKRLARFRWLAALVLLVLCYNFGNSLGIAIIHSLEVWRYNTIQLIFAALAQFLAIWFLIEVAIDFLVASDEVRADAYF
jgi:hypothetical protein